MKTVSRFLLAASVVFAVAFTFSCSGDDGKDGKTPYIGENGNWFIDGKDTGVNAQGRDGNSGDGGKDASPCTLEQDAEGRGPATITCGENSIVIPFCNGEVYSMAKNVCDGNGNLYGIVAIGGQTWMAEDLKGGTANKFTWEEATADGICPDGWKLPSKADFDALVLKEDFEDSWEGTGSWWSSDEADTEEAYRLYNKQVSTSGKGTTYAIRCLKDN